MMILHWRLLISAYLTLYESFFFSCISNWLHFCVLGIATQRALDLRGKLNDAISFCFSFLSFLVNFVLINYYALMFSFIVFEIDAHGEESCRAVRFADSGKSKELIILFSLHEHFLELFSFIEWLQGNSIFEALEWLQGTPPFRLLYFHQSPSFFHF